MYLYLRENENYNIHNVYKLGITNNINECDEHYSKSELTKGKFAFIIQLIHNNPNLIIKFLQILFTQYEFKKNIGNNFYDKKILNLIEDVLIECNISHYIVI